MTKQQKQNVIEFITERDAIVEDLGNRPADVAYLDGAINALRIAGVDIEFNSNSRKWVIY